jgi:hypothetical protein
MRFPYRRFARHYLEMVVAMFAGMIVLGLPAEGLLVAAGTGTSELRVDAPDAVLLGMATIMTVPMVAWMRYRRHGWQPCLEMSAAMYLPTLGVMALGWTGVVGEFSTQMGIQHVVMFPAMLGAMLLRPGEYARCDAGTSAPSLA